MSENIIFTAFEEDEAKRIDKFLTEKHSDITRSAFHKLIEEGNVLVGEKRVNKNYKLRVGEKVSLFLPEPEETNIEPENIPLNILYEDEDVIVINKPKGMVVHPAPGHYSGTLVNALMYHCKDSLSGINGQIRPGIVHRIDKDTSGVLVAAKNDVAHIFLSEQLSSHSMNRVYNAIVYNAFNEEEGSVDANIDRAKNDRKKMAVTKEGGRRAVTHYKVLERLGRFTFLSFKLETGRTHQIRVHMSHIGHPLLGDEVYGPKNKPFDTEGQVLHAKTLGFIHPRTKEYMEFDTPLPEYFEKILKILRNKGSSKKCY
ncbi:MAG: RluA family pseudouridine synthase [Firmicutes bacterium]|nr:RluA family pseudouridine synthase [Bacillota bacterium]